MRYPAKKQERRSMVVRWEGMPISSWSPFWHCWCIVLLVPLALAQTTERQPSQGSNALVILTEQLPRAFLRSPYSFQVKAQGGTEPHKWKIEEGELPPGLELTPSGTLMGRPASVGDFRFRVGVEDSAAPPQKQTRWLVLRVGAPLPLSWKGPLEVKEDKIIGSVEVSNATDDDFDLTLIVVAVNETGKAFALGYEHVTLARGSKSLVVEFGSSLPRGSYIVHADAVAEIASKNLIHRSRLQTPLAFRIP